MVKNKPDKPDGCKRKENYAYCLTNINRIEADSLPDVMVGKQFAYF